MRAVITLLLVVALASATTLAFHFEVVKTMPVNAAALKSAPDRLEIWLSETPAEGVSAITLTGPSGAVKIGATTIVAKEKAMFATVPSGLGAGAYVFGWRSAGDDGHVQTGTVKFTVAPTPRF